MVDLEKVRYPCITDTHTNTVVALAQAETEVKLELQVGARLTEKASIKHNLFERHRLKIYQK